jgi:hypothetical protein
MWLLAQRGTEGMKAFAHPGILASENKNNFFFADGVSASLTRCGPRANERTHDDGRDAAAR